MDHPEEVSEERTEPHSQSFIKARLESIHVEEVGGPAAGAHFDTVPLDTLVVDEHHHKQGIRILVRPLTRSRSVSPGNDSCQWLALRAEVASSNQPEHQVLAVTQTPRDIKFSVRIPADNNERGDVTPRPPLWCELYYDPASDNQILLNLGDDPIRLENVTRQRQFGLRPDYMINPGQPKALSPGSWRISVYGKPVLDFRILEKKPATLEQPPPLSSSSSDVGSLNSSDFFLNSSGKRSFAADDDDEGGDSLTVDKRQRVTGGKEDGVIMFLRPTTEPLIFPLPKANKGKQPARPEAEYHQQLIRHSDQPLLELDKDETATIPGVCELDSYQVTKTGQIASTNLSSVFTAEHSNVPDGIVTVKVLKTRMPPSHGTVGKSSAGADNSERNVIRQADVWMRELRSQEDLQHKHIVQLYGGDARHLSLYMEHVDARDLASRGHWRETASDMFTGSRDDARRILRDIAGALQYIHDERGLVHNDIKPANILYSPDRGAVLCDFGLSTPKGNPATTGGTPYYVPPEFLGRKLRGAPSDVWALGVVMLYVLRRIAFPDARGRDAHPRRLYWMIADVNRRDLQAAQGRSAVSQMQQWLAEVTEARARLNTRDRLEALVSDMLVLNPNQRITMARILKELQKDLVHHQQQQQQQQQQGGIDT